MSAAEVDKPRPPPSVPQNSPRKRRKRAPAAGAAADCFTCSNRGAKCDRRRPYCSRCLEDGKDCSGYKTQLTWGVGVASRGKLRGLSLPVAGTKRVAAQTPPERSKKRQATSIEQERVPSNDYKLPPISIPSGDLQRVDASPQTGLYYHSPSTNSIHQISPWEAPGPSLNPQLPPDDYKFVSKPLHAFTLPPPNIPSPPISETNYLQHPTQVNYSNHDRLSQPPDTDPSTTPYAQTLQQPSVPVPPVTANYPSFPQYSSYQPPPENISFPTYPKVDGSYVQQDAYTLATSSNFDPQQDSLITPQLLLPLPQDEDVIEEIQRRDLEDECAIIDDVSTYSGPLSLDLNLPLTPFSGALGIGKTPRMQYLINYYTEVISPVIVAFDGPNNPYRTQILRLAAKSETLQHAISALAASNLRQRRETGALSTGRTDPARRSSMAHLSLTDETWHQAALLSPAEQAREEVFHKNYAIRSLNQQLADPVLRKEDSILAILLILCLFHICDSGVAKFQTQFAGVRKLLSLRSQDLTTPETKWFTRMFTWFDVMTAAVNDREGQLQGVHLDISASSDEEWSLENLAGCDGQLFKTIGQLGRLNVLAQNKPVESTPTIVSKPLPPLPFADNDLPFFDGNGWLRLAADEDLFTSQQNTNTQFWREWRELRHDLQTWTIDPNSYTPDLTPDQRLDLLNISECFRYSALLYTERLANPKLRSTAPEIQSWVRHSLDYIRLVKSDVYLLWPLFITGSECVDESDRNIIRERCLDIQKDSGFLNNKSCLELLEKVWAVNNPGKTAGDDVDGQGDGEAGEDVEEGFRFVKVMRAEGNEGEYIVV